MLSVETSYETSATNDINQVNETCSRIQYLILKWQSDSLDHIIMTLKCQNCNINIIHTKEQKKAKLYPSSLAPHTSIKQSELNTQFTVLKNTTDTLQDVVSANYAITSHMSVHLIKDSPGAYDIINVLNAYHKNIIKSTLIVEKHNLQDNNTVEYINNNKHQRIILFMHQQL